jgi:N-acyl-L-homoserine lactone synthetase
MGYIVRAASTSSDEAAVFRGRHLVYVDEMKAMPPTLSGTVQDRFDGRPDTLNLVVDLDGAIVGGARFVVDTGQGTTADAYYDFGPHLPSEAVRGAGSMLWMLKSARGERGLITQMMRVGMEWSEDQGVTHILATVNPHVASRFSRVGYVPLGDPFVDPKTGLPVQPMVLEMAQAKRQAA